MSDSLMMHRVTRFYASRYHPENSNALTLTVEHDGRALDLTLFQLDAEIAAGIYAAINNMPANAEAPEQVLGGASDE